jgi:hypothetical protein
MVAMKRSTCILGSVLLVTVAGAQQKPISPQYVRDFVDARTIAVVAASQSQLSAEGVQENERARLEVQQALRKWGKYEVTLDTATADLIVVVRKGHRQATTADPSNRPPIVFDPGDSGINIGIHHGQNPPLSRTDTNRTTSGTRIGSEMSSGEDLFDVYLGNTPLPGDGSRNQTQYPLDEPPAWSYMADDALNSPKLEAVVVFKKAVEAAEKKKP